MGKNNKKRNSTKLIKDRLYILMCAIITLFVIFYCFRLKVYNFLLDSDSQLIEARIVNEKNILGKGIITQMYTYSYKFYIKEEYYTGDSRDQKYKINDTIKVEYWPFWPGINRPKNK